MVMDGNWSCFSDDHFIMYKNIKKLWCTPESNLTLYYYDNKNVEPLKGVQRLRNFLTSNKCALTLFWGLQLCLFFGEKGCDQVIRFIITDRAAGL